MTKRIILLLSTLSVLLSCGRQTRILLDDVETYIDSRPDSALTVLRTVGQRSLHGRETKAQYSLLYAKALDKNYIDTTDVEIIRPAVDYYSRKRNAEKAAESLLYLGRMQSNAGDYTAAIVTYTKAEKLLAGVDNPHLAALLYSSMSYIYSKCHDRDEDLKYAIKSYEKCVEVADAGRMRQALYYVAQAYMNADEWAVADSLYRLLLADPEVVGTLRGQILSSYGHLNVCKPEPDYLAATEAFGQSIDLAGSLNSVNHWGSYAIALSKAGQDESADRIIESLEGIGEEASLYWKSMVESVRNEYESAFHDLMSSLLLKDATIVAESSNSVAKAQRDYYSMQNERNELRLQRKNLTLTVIVLIFIICIGSITMLMLRRRRISEQERQDLMRNLEMVNAIYHDELQESRREIADLKTRFEAERIALRREYYQLYKSQFDYFREVGKVIMQADSSDYSESRRIREIHDRVREMTMFIKSDDDGQRRFESEINHRLDGVMSKFRADFPDMKEEDYRLVGFFFAQFNSSLISMVYPRVSVRAAQSKKYRIRNMIKASDSLNKDLFLFLLEN